MEIFLAANSFIMSFIIRKAKHSDAEGIIDAHVNSIRTICAKDYTDEQIEAWTGRKFRADLWCQTIDRDFVWVIVKESKILGFGHLALMDEEIAEVLGLYFIPPAIGQGFGKLLFWEMLKVCEEKNLKRLILHATITAKPFYQKLGFYQSGGDDSIEMRGVAIPCFPMEYVI